MPIFLHFGQIEEAVGYTFPTTGLFAGGYNVNIMEYIDVTTTTQNATDKGDMTTARYGLATLYNSDYAFFTGGSGTNVIDYTNSTTSTENASDMGDSTLANSYYNAGGVMGGTYGFFGGGNITGTDQNVIEYINMSSTSQNATDVGDLTVARYGLAGTMGGTYGFRGGGRTASPFTVNTIDYIDLSSTSGNATDKGDLTTARGYIGGVSSTSYGFYAGGAGTSGSNRLNIIDYIDVTTTSGNASDRGDLIAGMYGVGNTSGGTYGFFGGGTTGVDRNYIQYIDVTTTSGNATDIGDLTSARRHLAV